MFDGGWITAIGSQLGKVLCFATWTQRLNQLSSFGSSSDPCLPFLPFSFAFICLLYSSPALATSTVRVSPRKFCVQRRSNRGLRVVIDKICSLISQRDYSSDHPFLSIIPYQQHKRYSSLHTNFIPARVPVRTSSDSHPSRLVPSNSPHQLQPPLGPA